MIVFLVVLTLCCWVPLLWMLRDDRPRLYSVVAPAVLTSVPVVTFDSRGLV